MPRTIHRELCIQKKYHFQKVQFEISHIQSMWASVKRLDLMLNYTDPETVTCITTRKTSIERVQKKTHCKLFKTVAVSTLRKR